jgi:hypothetical protein
LKQGLGQQAGLGWAAGSPGVAGATPYKSMSFATSKQLLL